MNKSNQKTRKGFSLVELVIAILIIAVLVAAVFAGGSIIIRNSQISRTTSDLHNFSIAIETWLNSETAVANSMGMDDVQNPYNTTDTALVKALNTLLPEDYQLRACTYNKTEALASMEGTNAGKLTTNITYVQGEADTSSQKNQHYVFESIKTDAWGNNYYVILTNEDRTAAGHSDFYVTVVSAGPNAKTAVAGDIDADDVFLLAQYTDGDVASQIFNYADANTTAAKLPRTNNATLTRATTYDVPTAADTTCPVVFAVNE